MSASQDPSPKGEQPRSQSILDRAFHGPETSDAKVERSSWLEKASVVNPTADGSPVDEPVRDHKHQVRPDPTPPAPQPSRRGWHAGIAAVLLMSLAFLAGYLIHPSESAPAEITAATPESETETELEVEPEAEPEIGPEAEPDVGPDVTVTQLPQAEPTVDQEAETEPATPVSVSTAIDLDFATGRSTLDSESTEMVETFIAALPEDTTIVVVGHGDADAEGPLNTALGELRADTVGDLLESADGRNQRVLAVVNSRTPDGTVRVLSFTAVTPGQKSTPE